MIVLDTNVLSEVWKPTPDPRFTEWWGQVDENLVTTSISVGELLAGVALLPEGRRKTALHKAITTAVETIDAARGVLPYDLAAANAVGQVVVRRRDMGRPIGQADAMIAAICLAQNAVLATRNVKDFEGTGVTVINPWE